MSNFYTILVIILSILMVILLSYLVSDLQRSSTYCYRYTAILSFRGLLLIGLQCLYVASKGEPRLPKLLAKPEILEEFRNLDRGLRPGQKWSMKKEDVSYSVMDIKKGLWMIRLCNLLYEKSIQFAAQQTRVLLYPGI